MSPHEPNADGTMKSGSFQADEQFAKGVLLGGRYRVVDILGKGGMGTVYKVEQIFIGSELALKTINTSSMSEINIRRFQAEAKASFAVNHPNVISMHDFGLLDDLTPFMAMELVHGKTLADMLKTRALTVEQALPIFIQVCAGLAHAHKQGVVHRDIKPSNIMVLDEIPTDTEGSVKILDFGIAKLSQHAEGEMQSLTKTGEVFGSPLYMSPEQCSGGVVDNRSDIYSLGCVIFETLTGTSPFVGENALTTMIMHQSSTIPTLREGSLGENFPKDLESVVEMMLAKDPRARYQDAALVLKDLISISKGEALSNTQERAKASQLKTKAATNKVTMPKNVFVASLVLNALLCCAAAAIVSHIIITPKPVRVPMRASDQRQPLQATTQITELIKKGDNVFKAAYGSGKLDLAEFKDYTEAQKVLLDQERINDGELKYLRNSQILILELRECIIGTINSIRDLPYLQSLDLHGTQVDDRAIPIITSLKMLEEVNLGHTKVTQEGIQKLVKSTSLRNVTLPALEYTPQYISELEKAMPQCRIDGYRGENFLNQLSRDMKKYGVSDYDRCKKLLVIAEKANPMLSVNSEYYQRMAEIRQSEGKIDEARKLALKALDISKRNGNLLLAIEPLKLLAKTVVARKMPSQENYEEYASRMNEAAKIATATKMHNSNEYMKLMDATTTHPAGSPLYAYELANVDTANKYIKQYPAFEKDFYELFHERSAVYCLMFKQYSRGVYIARELSKWCATKYGTESAEHAKALVLQGRLEVDRSQKESALIDAVKLFDEVGCPDNKNFKEYYCDACRDLIEIYDGQQNSIKSEEYCRKALAQSDTISNDTDKRKEMFAKMLIVHLKKTDQSEAIKELMQKYKLSSDSLN